jgi:hypothetical protein
MVDLHHCRTNKSCFMYCRLCQYRRSSVPTGWQANQMHAGLSGQALFERLLRTEIQHIEKSAANVKGTWERSNRALTYFAGVSGIFPPKLESAAWSSPEALFVPPWSHAPSRQRCPLFSRCAAQLRCLGHARLRCCAFCDSPVCSKPVSWSVRNLPTRTPAGPACRLMTSICCCTSPTPPSTSSSTSSVRAQAL